MNQPLNEHHDSEDGFERSLERLGRLLREQDSIQDDVMDRINERNDEARGGPNSSPSYPFTRSLFLQFGELSMFQKVSVGTVAASVTALGLVLLSGVMSAPLLWADVLQNVREATSYSAQIKIETPVEGGLAIQTGAVHWRAPDAFRMENEVKMPGGRVQSSSVMIRFGNQRGISLDMGNKTYRYLAAAAGAKSPVMAVQNLPDFEDESTKRLGERVVSGKPCYGFSIPMQKVDESIPEGTLTVWVDPSTKLPSEIVMEMYPGVTMTTFDFRWNQKLDASLFDITPPKGFVESKTQRRELSDEDKAKEIISSLRLFSKLSDGAYPNVRVIYGDVIQMQMLKMAGFEGPPFDKKAIASKEFNEITLGTRGFGHMTVLMRDQADARYFGKTVGAADKEKVLFSWKGKNGKKNLIHGDLRYAVE